MKKFVKNIGENAVKFVKDNRGVILRVAETICIDILYKTLNIPMRYPTNGVFYRRDYTPVCDYIIPRNSVEAVVYAIYKSTISMSMDAYKIDGAKKIYKLICETDNVDDQTRAFAITLMSKIANSMLMDAYKDDVNDLISKIAKSAQ